MRQFIRVILVLAAGAAAACGRGEAGEEVGIQSVAVARGNLRITAEAVGSIEPVRRVDVKSKASGEIKRLYADVGDVVETGALLAEVDPRDVRNRYDQAVADLEVAQAQASNAASQLQRSQELHAAGVLTDQELESARLQATNAQAGLTRSRTNLELAQLQLGDVTIRAPMAGTILQKNVEEGTVIQSASGSVSGGTALYVMAALDEMQVRTLVDETDIGQLRAGLATTVRVQAHPGRTFEGTVQQIEPQAVVQQNVTKFPVIISLDNREGLLKPGMNGEVEILIDQANGVLLLDNTAIVLPQDALPAALALGLEESAVDMAALVPPSVGGGRARAAGAPGGELRGGGGGGGGVPGGGGRGGAGGFGGGRGGGGRGAGVTRGAVVGASAVGAQGTVRTTRRAVVFVIDSAGVIAPKGIEIGLNDWNRTEVVSGLEEGQMVALVGAAQLQAQQQAQQLAGRGGLGGLLGGGAVPGGGRGGGGGGRGF